MCVVAWMIYFVYPIPSNGVIETGYRLPPSSQRIKCYMCKILCIYTFVHADQINTSIRCVTATNDAVEAHDSLVVNDIPELL